MRNNIHAYGGIYPSSYHWKVFVIIYRKVDLFKSFCYSPSEQHILELKDKEKLPGGLNGCMLVSCTNSSRFDNSQNFEC